MKTRAKQNPSEQTRHRLNLTVLWQILLIAIKMQRFLGSYK